MKKLSFKRKRLSRRSVVLLILTVLALGIFGAGYALNKLMTSPAVGSVATTMPSLSRAEPVELQQFDGTHISFVHPMPYIKQEVKDDKNKSPNTIESHLFVSSGMVSKVLTIVVSKLPSGKLDDDPSYVMRTQNPDKYTLKPSVLKNEKVMVSTASDGQQHQQTVFWVHGDKLLTFTMSGVASDTSALTAEFQDMIGTISWR